MRLPGLWKPLAQGSFERLEKIGFTLGLLFGAGHELGEAYCSVVNGTSTRVERVAGAIPATASSR